MTAYVLGLLLFFATHSLRIFADDWRNAQLARFGEQRWKGLYGLASLLGLGLMLWGFGMARGEPLTLWAAPTWMRHLTALLTLPAFILVVAGYLPGNRLKAAIGHPMVAGVGLWALAHLPANGRLHDLLLFGPFLVWAVIDFAAARRRDRLAGTTYPPGSTGRDVRVVAIGVLAWALFAFVLHARLIGVRPF